MSLGDDIRVYLCWIGIFPLISVAFLIFWPDWSVILVTIEFSNPASCFLLLVFGCLCDLWHTTWQWYSGKWSGLWGSRLPLLQQWASVVHGIGMPSGVWDTCVVSGSRRDFCWIFDQDLEMREGFVFTFLCWMYQSYASILHFTYQSVSDNISYFWPLCHNRSCYFEWK